MTGFTVAGSGLCADYAVDLLLAYVLGLVFQYFAIAPMRNLSGWPGAKAAIQADTVSLVAFEVGMFAWMALVLDAGRDSDRFRDGVSGELVADPPRA